MITKYIITTTVYLMIAIEGIAQIVAKPSSIISNIYPHPSHYDYSQEATIHLNYKHFVINIEESGCYYAEFWLLPAEYPDGTYTKFSVYVNEIFVGSINPHRDNWQSARIAGQEKIELQEGYNVISIAVPNPETPMVEMMKIALDDMDAAIPSSAYDEYYDNVTKGISYYVPEEEQAINFSNILQSDNVSEFAVHHFQNVPLLYTFFTELYFQEGDYMEVLTSSLSEHDVDIMYLGRDDSINPNQNVSPIFPYTYGQPEMTPMEYISATSEEMQGLNWKGISLKSPTTQAYKIFKTIRIPKSGIYHIRLRHRQSGKTGIASILINNKGHGYSYNKVPISFSYVECEIPANNKEYGTMTLCANPEKDDPMLYIHGASADRIVGFGDDVSSDLQRIHGLSSLDSHVLLQYYVKTSGISISNVNSSVPESTCQILAGMDESLVDSYFVFSPKPMNNAVNRLSNLKNDSNSVRINESLEQCGTIKIVSQSEINRITIMNTNGEIFKTFNGSGLTMSILKSSCGIKTPGLYIVRVETAEGITTRKILIL